MTLYADGPVTPHHWAGAAVNLNHLRFAHAVSETLSFARAAEASFVTQPTLSAGIAQLERELGGRLFVRTTRRVDLTPFGAEMMPIIKRILDGEAALRGAAMAHHGPVGGLIRLGYSPLVDPLRLEAVLAPFRAVEPDVEIASFESNLADLVVALQEGHADVIVAPIAPHLPGAGCLALYREAVVYVPRGGPTPDAASSVKVGDLAGETFVLVTEACGLASATRELFRSRRVPVVEYSGKAPSYQALQQWASEGLGAAVLPLSRVSGVADSARCMIVGDDGHPITLEFQMVWRRDPPESRHLRMLIEHIRSNGSRLETVPQRRGLE